MHLCYSNQIVKSWKSIVIKVGQSLLVKRQLVMEKQLKEKMIHSVMPPKVADWLMKGGIDDDDDDVDIDSETGILIFKYTMTAKKVES